MTLYRYCQMLHRTVCERRQVLDHFQFERLGYFNIDSDQLRETRL